MPSPRVSNGRSNVYLLSFANFIASLGSGAVLSKGMFDLLDLPLVKGDSIFAFLIGGLVALVLLLAFRQQLKSVGFYFPIAAALVCLGLWDQFGFHLQSGQIALHSHAWLFFVLLCVFYALTSVARSVRSDIAATFQNQLILVELGYAAGYTLALLVCVRIPGMHMGHALLFSVFCFGVAGGLDFIVRRNLLALKKQTSEESAVEAPATERMLGPAWVAGTLVVASTLGVQCISQMVARLSGSTAPLAAFDIGTTLAPIVGGLGAMNLFSNGSALRSARVVFQKWGGRGIWFAPAAVMGIGFVTLGVIGGADLLASPTLFALPFLLGGFIYEAAALVVLDWVGKQPVPEGTVAVIFGVLAFFNTLAYWAFLHFRLGYSDILVLSVFCLVVFIYALGKRFTYIFSATPASEIEPALPKA